MKTILKNAILVLMVIIFSCQKPVQKYTARQVPFNQVKITDQFWGSRLEAHAHATLATCIAQTQDSTGRINNFIKAAGLMEGGHEGIYFDDSDVYKAMEGISYSLVNNPNPELDALLDKWIAYMAKAQQPDGYLNTFYTLNGLDKRWTDMEKHEMYCAGHMMEAAVAHHKATGKTTFLNIATKYADYLCNTFGPSKKDWVPGHEEIELALVKLFHETGQQKYLDLSYWLLEERGHGHGRGAIWDNKDWGPGYCQDDVPVSDISEIKGHAVRAMYLFSGMADVAAEKGLPQYVAALERVWDDVVNRNMYITGGIGSSVSNEGFTEDYDLPNKEAYCETCASIGMVLWNERMNLFSQDAKYIDVMERSMYNGVLAGVSIEGDRFFYVNPLESDGNHHRREWYGCACCPSNVSRFLPSVGSYIYSISDDKRLFVNLYVGSASEIKIGKTTVEVIQHTDYPWDGNVDMEVNPEKESNFAVNLRIPGWCKKYTLKVNGESLKEADVDKGYVTITKKWKKGDKITLNLDMPVEMVAADPKVLADKGKRAIQRGPLVYCMEETDQPENSWGNIQLYANTNFKVKKATDKLAGMLEIEGETAGQLFSMIPYFAWDNREAGKMKVWINYTE